MKTDDFDYYLPENLIAQTPLDDRTSSKLMLVDKKTGKIKDEVFSNIINYLKKGDVLVLNNTKVLPARLIGEKEETKAVIEILLLKELKDNIWECLAKPARRIKKGTIITFGNGKLRCECIETFEEGIVHLKMIYDGIFLEILESLGEMPLPPYIHEKLENKDRYQTVYAKEVGSAAAPTAGLHFTKELLENIKAKGVEVLYITLHVGLGTFRPVKVDDVSKHTMHTEHFYISKEVAERLNKAKEENRRIISVGTTTTRTLESVMQKYNKFVPCNEDTNIFIYPGYKFKAIDVQITNFHLPKSTLIMLVSAFATKEIILNAYNNAVKNKYRFFSFGDAMMIGDFKDE